MGTTESSVEEKGETTITEQPASIESSTEVTVTPDKSTQDNIADSGKQKVETELKDEILDKSQETMQSSVIMSDSADPKLEVSSEEGSYDVIKHRELESEGHTTSQNADEDEEF